MNIPAKFGSNWPSEFEVQKCRLKLKKCTDDDDMQIDDNGSNDPNGHVIKKKIFCKLAWTQTKCE